MTRATHRDKILSEGLRLVHARGFKGASVRDIVQAAGVPQGSFTNHFASKEAFGLEVIELYLAASRELTRATLYNDALPPLARLAAYLDAAQERMDAQQMRQGCLLGNFTAEASDHSEPMRLRLVAIFGELRQAFAHCLRAAVQAGEVRATLDCDEVAGFMVSAWQGAILMAKAQQSPEPLAQFRAVLFATVLGAPAS
jgi:TetR/AcrR family transcriptional repressor of nem operon